MKNINRKYKSLLFFAAVISAIFLPLSVRNMSAAKGVLLFRDYDDSYTATEQNEFDVYIMVQEDNAVDDSFESQKELIEVPTEKKININTASKEDLADALPGIGDKKAEAIVEYRERTGGFRSVDELIEVDGIGEKLLEEIRPYCVLTDEELYG